MKRKIFLVAFCITVTVVTFCCIFACHQDTGSNKLSLKFREDGTFKIVQFTDLHIIDQSPRTAKTVETIRFVLNTEKPDMAVLTGDQTIDKPSQEVFKLIASVFDEAKMPFALVFGNHDAETITKEEAFSILSKTPYFLGEAGPQEVSGYGNYIIPIQASQSAQTAALLYCFDSGVRGIQHSHVAWYRKESARLAKEFGDTIQALAFLHIPLTEYSHIRGKLHTKGQIGEPISAERLNHGLLASMVEMKDVMGVFVGHCHEDEAIGLHHNIALGFGRVGGADAYGGLERGGRVIELYEDKPHTFHSWIRVPSGVVNMYYYPAGITADEESMSTYLPALAVKPTKQGVSYNYYEGKFKSVDELAGKKVVSSGTMPTFSIKEAKASDEFGYAFKTYIKIPVRGVYCFFTRSDDGSKLLIDGKLVVDNDGSRSAKEKDGVIALEAGFHEVHLLYFEDYMGEELKVSMITKDRLKTGIPEEWLYAE
ncbi:metallophosphatase [Bacteroidia bacterium]|nr:metallophosphatase [Bacteroidia bacterium]